MAVRTGFRCSSVAATLAVLLLLGQCEWASAQVEGVDVNAVDIFPPACKFFDPPPAGWKLWSDPATWGPSGVVPGIGPGGVGQAATVPCGMAVLLDVTSLNVTQLRISGHLKVLDDPKLGPITVEAKAILVEGQLTIGTPEEPFRGRIIFTLTPPSPRADVLITRPPAAATNPRSVGYKVFAIVGGQVHLHGMPGGGNTPAWVRLNRTAAKGDTQLVVNGNVEAWPVGGKLFVTSTDYAAQQAEELTITNVTRVASGWAIGVAERLRFMHWGDALESGFPGVGLDQRAEVGLLTRNILIQGSPEAGSLATEGGHFIVFQTQTPQYIEGVELVNMGQQGTLGRYPMHFHLCGDTRNESYVRKLSIHESQQRCVVIHGTHNLLVEENVAYNTSGHCFMLEDGIETGNVLVRNLGAITLPVQKLIPRPPSDFKETDNKPSTFWLSNPNNTLRGNVAAGAADSGFWYELNRRVKGVSANIPGADKVIPFNVPIGEFADNVAHSCVVGLRTYPNGHHPQRLVGDTLVPVDNFVERFTAYKNAFAGAQSHHTKNMVVKDSAFADNAIGVDLSSVQACRVEDSLFVGESANIGNPNSCNVNATTVNCLPLHSCTLPMAAFDGGGRARTKPQPFTPKLPIVGVAFGQDIFDTPGAGNLVERVYFAGYQPLCGIPAAAVSILGKPLNYFNAAHGVRNLTYAPGTNPFWLDPSLVTSPDPEWNAASTYALRDLDGSLLGGGTPGFLVTNNTAMLPMRGDGGYNGGCLARPEWGVYLCRGVCYRSLRVRYTEPGYNNSMVPNDFRRSYVVIRRVEDNSTTVYRGNLKDLVNVTNVFIDPATKQFQRYFYATLVAASNYSYEIQVVPGSLGQAPAELEVGLVDDTGCTEGLQVRILSSDPTQQWVVKNNAFDQRGGLPLPRSCPSSVAPLDITSTYTVCGAASTGLALDLAGVVPPGGLRFIPLRSGVATPSTCSGVAPCGLFAAGAQWGYRDDGVEQTNPPFYAPPTSTPSGKWEAAPGWKNGSAPFVAGGAAPPRGTAVAQTSSSSNQRVVTYYFRKVFTVGDPACYSALQLGWLAVDGHVVYLNGKEVVRANLPDKRTAPEVHMNTYAVNLRGGMVWDKSVIPVQGPGAPAQLMPGVNYLAVEVHVAQMRGPGFAFDAWLSANYSCGQQATRIYGTSPLAEAPTSSVPITSAGEKCSRPLWMLMFSAATMMLLSALCN